MSKKMAANLRAKTITIRVLPENFDIIRQAAEREMRTVSNFMEFYALERARAVLPPIPREGEK